MRRLEDRVVVVTGGSRGLGRAIALEAAHEGARVIVGYRRREREANEVVAEAGSASCAIALDVRDPASVERFFGRILEAHGRIDGLVTSAGIVSDGWLATTPIERWDDVVGTNLRGTMLTIRGALRSMMSKKQGSIVALASIAAIRANPGQASYAASKGGILALTKVLAMEYGRHGIRINAMAPGGTEISDRVTPRQFIRPGMTVEEDPAETEYRREMADDIRSQQALRRRGLPEEQAAAIAFLASDDASFITGQVINCSGGQS
jgi:NAD(P)-dependent dehydrogenase (short-subunit alcohol dehydrogenase family)